MGIGKAIELWLALLAGIVFVLAFAPFKVFPLAFITLGLLFWLWLNCQTPKRAFVLGWLFGFGQFGAGVSWMYVSLNTFGNMAPLLAGLAVLLLVIALALFPAIVGYSQALFSYQPIAIRLFFVITPIWILAEWVREWIFTGLPWLSVGYSQTDNPLAGWAPFGGIYLVSMFVLLITCALILLFNKKIISAILCLILVFSGAYFVDRQQWTERTDQSLSVKLLQGNVSIWDKWNTAKTDEILNKYISMSQQGSGADLVIWPEAAAPLLLSQLPENFWQRVSQTNNSQTMLGIVEQDIATGKLYNSVAASQLNVEINQEIALYRKIHLVPFGEFLPLKFLLEWLLNYLHIPMSDFSAYKQQQAPIDINGIKVGVSICYEDAFPNVIRSSLPEANILVNVSEDAWFGNSLAPHQRLQMAQMRARENGRSLVRVSNNGLSAIIDHQGEVLNLAPQFETIVLEGEAKARIGATPFSLWGHKLVLSIVFALFAVALIISLLPVRKNYS